MSDVRCGFGIVGVGQKQGTDESFIKGWAKYTYSYEDPSNLLLSVCFPTDIQYLTSDICL
jgi:hypothetical protein